MIETVQGIWIVLTLLFAYGAFALFLGPSREQLGREFESSRARYETRGGLIGKLGGRVNSWHWWIVERALSIVAVLGAIWFLVSVALLELMRSAQAGRI